MHQTMFGGSRKRLGRLNSTPEKAPDYFTPDSCSGGSADGSTYTAYRDCFNITVCTGKLATAQPALAIQDFSVTPNSSLPFWLAGKVGLAGPRSLFRDCVARAQAEFTLARIHDGDEKHFIPEHPVYLLSGTANITAFFRFVESYGTGLSEAHKAFEADLPKPPTLPTLSKT